MTFINITFVQLPVETPVCNAPKTAIFNTSVDRVECYATCTKSTVRMKGDTHTNTMKYG